MARKTSKAIAPHSASSSQVEDRLRARHIDFKLEPNLGIDTIVDAEGQQVRSIEHRAPGPMVTRFAEQMKAGATFPAIVINENGELIDGNTRRLAAVKAGRSTIAAYICHGLTPLQARSLSVELNQCHGLSMTDEEIYAFVRGAVQEGQSLDTKAYARMTGVRPAKLERWKAQATFQLRARRCGIPDAHVAGLPGSAQAALNGIRLTPVLIAATSLATAGRMTSGDIRKLVVAINAATSEAAALAVVAAERDSRGQDIRSIASGFSPTNRPSRRSAMHVAALLKITVDDLLDVAPDRRTATVENLCDLRAHLDRAIATANVQWGLEQPEPNQSSTVLARSGHG